MQNTSELYKDIVAQPNYWFECSLGMGTAGVLLTETGNEIVFGQDADGNDVTINVSIGGADGGYRENVLMSMSTTRKMFEGSNNIVGCCVAGEIDVEMIYPSWEIPQMAKMIPYVRATDGERVSEWLQKGVFYIDTRTVDESWEGVRVVKIHGYDDMLKAEQDYNPTMLFPADDVSVVTDIANIIGVDVDERTFDTISGGMTIQYPTGYSCREVLGFIASAYAGNFIMSDEGKLLFVGLNSLPQQTNYLLDDVGYTLVVDDSEGETGEDVRILI